MQSLIAPQASIMSTAADASGFNSLRRWPRHTPRRQQSLTGVRFSPASVCLFVRTISQKPTQLGSPNLTQKCSTTTSPGNPFILESKGQRSRSFASHENIAGMGYSLHFCECWFLLVNTVTISGGGRGRPSAAERSAGHRFNTNNHI